MPAVGPSIREGQPPGTFWVAPARCREPSAVGRGYLRVWAMHGGQGLDGAEVVLQLGDELLLASQRGHGLRQLDLQLRAAHWKTEPGPSPRAGPKPQILPSGHRKAEKPPPRELKPTLWQQPHFLLISGSSRWDHASHPSSAPGEGDPGCSPPWRCPRVGSRPRAGPAPRPSAGGNVSRQLLAPARLLQVHQENTFGALGVPGSILAGQSGGPEGG